MTSVETDSVSCLSKNSLYYRIDRNKCPDELLAQWTYFFTLI